jgi:hypothetical protein
MSEVAVMRRMHMMDAPASPYLPAVYGLANICVAMPTTATRARMRCGLVALCTASEWISGVNAFRWMHLATPSIARLSPVPAPASAPSSGEAVGMQTRLDLAAELVRAVRHLHSLGIVHRDIALGNIVLSAPSAEGEGLQQGANPRPHSPTHPHPRVRATLVDFNMSILVDEPSAENDAPLEADALAAAVA